MEIRRNDNSSIQAIDLDAAHCVVIRTAVDGKPYHLVVGHIEGLQSLPESWHNDITVDLLTFSADGSAGPTIHRVLCVLVRQPDTDDPVPTHLALTKAGDVVPIPSSAPDQDLHALEFTLAFVGGRIRRHPYVDAPR